MEGGDECRRNVSSRMLRVGPFVVSLRNILEPRVVESVNLNENLELDSSGKRTWMNNATKSIIRHIVSRYHKGKMAVHCNR